MANRSAQLEPQRWDLEVRLRAIEEQYSTQVLFRVLLRKIVKRLLYRSPQLRPIAQFNGLLVFDRPELHGGGLYFGQNFPRFLVRRGFRPCERIFEFCAGPGYIGYSLLAGGFCDKLTLADVNPLAVQAAAHTREYNMLTHLVNIYLSDGLADIPESESWDLVVGNPPHWHTKMLPQDIIKYDPGWSVHRSFYSQAKKFMKPKGRVVLLENALASNAETFEPMILKGGGRLVEVEACRSVTGKESQFYYILSEW
jgi:hypothetical protein